ncbi:hypothetical protein NQ317_013501 [Molorchus minor]|uniref:ZAD domain-containing protein n=1 Tax=Molorchus minor TaxID=1323400 RepID=A0ABQ9JW87_9CUCU|nr:hypothetical protein NQ317_013501 [Molorchus minor]
MWSPMEKCWVPNCLNSRDQGYSKNFFPLPKSERYKEIWLALAGKKSSGLEELIYYCQDHFDPLSLQTYSEKFIILDANATPFFNMPQRVCRTCMSVIVDGDIFCVLSANVPCTIPSEIKSELFTCRPEPLLQVLNFCIPELKLSLDPLPLTCYKCYYNIWLFYTFKVTCNSVEKNYLGHSGPSPYGKLMICRACPVTAGTSFFDLKEDSLLAKLLRKMFIQVQPTELVPLKVCLKCWNTLYQLEKFYMHCLEVETRMKRDTFHLQYDMSGPIPTPSSSTATQTFKSPPNAVKVHRRSLHPYRPHEPSTSTSISVNTPSTSMMRFDGRNQNKHGFGDNTGEALPNTMILPTTQLNVPLNSSKVEKSTDNKSLNTAQNVDSVKIKKETEVISISDDDAELRCTEFIDPWVKRTLNDTEKIALAELMLKYGLPFKTSTSPKIHFKAWVQIVREFIQLGHERP